MGRPSIINLNDPGLVFSEWGDGASLQASLTTLVQPLGTQKMACRLVVIPAGKVCWTYHFQFANEEIYMVLDGKGIMRHGDREYPLGAGDVISAPPVLGCKQQIENTGESDLRYLAVCILGEPDHLDIQDGQAMGEPADAIAKPEDDAAAATKPQQ